MTNHTSDPMHRREDLSGAHAPEGQDSAVKQKAAEAADQAQGQAKAVAHDAKEAAKDLAGTAQGHVADVKDEAVQQVKSFAGSIQEQLGSQAGSQQQRLAGQARGITDDLHRVLSGEQPQSDTLRQVFSSVADRAETLTQRLETAEPADLLREVRGFAARKPGTFLAVALGLGVVAGRLTRGMRDAAQESEPTAERYRQAPQYRREMEPMGVQGDVAPHHLPSTVPAHIGDDAARQDVPDSLPYGTAPLPSDIDPVTGLRVTPADPFDQTQPGGRA